MIKEIFEIEPVQKNSLIIFVGIFFLSFLQLYIFKNDILNDGIFVIIGLCLALTVCWSIISIPPLIFFFNTVEKRRGKNNNIILERVVFSLGILGIGWIGLLTYISYELTICFKDFIRLSILVSVVRAAFWLIYGIVLHQKKQN